MNRTDVLVVGGGIAGAATALCLARDGVSVRLIERASIGGLASGANAGSLHAQIPHDPFRSLGTGWARNFAPAIRLFIASLALWRGLEAELEADLEIGFGGGLLVGTTATELREMEAKAAIDRAAGLTVEWLEGAQLSGVAPYLASSALGGAFCPVEGKANPLLVAPAYARAAVQAGAIVEAHAGDASITRDGRDYVVDSGAGRHVARRLVIAAGAETGRLAAMLGARLAIEAFPIQVSVTEPTEPLVPHLVYCAGEKLTMKQTRAGSILIGGGWSARLDARGRPVVNAPALGANLEVASTIVPAIAGLGIVRSWAAYVNGTADWLPILGELAGAPGAFVNYVPWMGFTGAPAASLAVAAMVQGRAPPMDVPFNAFVPGVSGE